MRNTARSCALFACLLTLAQTSYASDRWTHGIDKDQMTGKVSQYWAKSPGNISKVGRQLVLSVVSVRCIAGQEPEVYFAFGSTLRFDSTLGIATARTKWDGGKVAKTRLGTAFKPLLNVLTEKADWIGWLSERNNLVVEIPVKGSAYPIFEFTLAGSSAAIEHVTSNCKPINR